MSRIVYLLSQIKPNILGMFHSWPFCNFLAQLSKLAFWMIGWAVAINSDLFIHFLEIALSPQIFSLKSFSTLWNSPYIHFLVIILNIVPFHLWGRQIDPNTWKSTQILFPNYSENFMFYFFENAQKLQKWSVFNKAFPKILPCYNRNES